MKLESRVQARSLAWSNPVSWWWAMLTLVSGINIAAWILMYRELHAAGTSGRVPGMEIMLLLSAAYVFGCAFRSFLPRADVQRICLFDTWLSSVAVGRSVATVAEVCFAAQWTMILLQLGTDVGGGDGGDRGVGDRAADPDRGMLFLVRGRDDQISLQRRREFASGRSPSSSSAIGLCRLLPEFNGAVRVVLGIAVIGIVFYIVFLMTVDVPMYLKRWRAVVAGGNRILRPMEGLRDVSTRWIVTHDISEWREEIAWMSLYFSAAVWASLALCVLYAAEGHIFW